MKKALPNVYVLTLICLITALIMAVVNSFTLPIITKTEEQKTRESLSAVLPDGGTFTEIELNDGITAYSSDTTILAAYKSSNGGYVIKVSGTGYSSGLQILFGVKDGQITGSECMSSSETLGYEKTYGDNLNNKDAAEISSVSTVSGATKTTAGYKKAAIAAIETAEKLNNN